MKFLNAEFENFKSFKGKHSFHFMNGVPGLYFVCGENLSDKPLDGNGVGKSTLFDLIYWIIFGKTTTSLKASNIHSWKTKGSTQGKLTIEFPYGTYSIFRSWSPNKLTITDPSGNSNDVEQIAVDKLIGLNEIEFQNTILFGQFTDTFLDLSSPEMMQLFSGALNLDYWTTKSSEATKKVSALSNQITGVNGEINYLNGKMESFLSTLTDWNDKSSSFDKTKKQEVLALRAKVSEKEAAKSLITSELQVPDFTKELMLLVTQAQKTQTQYDSEIKLVNELTNKKSGINTEIRLIQTQLSKLKSLSGTCSSCGQVIDLKQIKIEIANYDQKLASLVSLIRKIDTDVASLNESIIKLRINQQSILQKQGLLDNQKRDIINKNNLNKLRLDNILSEIKSLEAQLSKAKANTNPFLSMILSHEAKVAETISDLSKLDKSLASLNEDKAAYEVWIKGFKEIRLLVVEEALSELEVEANNSLIELGLDKWSLKFDVERETKSGSVSKGFTVLVETPYNDAVVPLESWSGGEGQRLRLAAVAGLSSLLLSRKEITSNISIFDEPTKHLSETGIENLLSFLKKRADDTNSQIYLIDHRSRNFHFDGVIKILKDKNGSRIVI